MNCPYYELWILEHLCELCRAVQGTVRDIELTLSYGKYGDIK